MSVQSNRVRRLIQMVSYKPGWRMTVVDHPTDIVRRDFSIVLFYSAQDFNDPTRISVFRYMRSMYDDEVEILTDAQVIDFFIARTIKDAELYEFDRWFNVTGRLTNEPSPNPHPQLPRTNQEVR